LNEKVRATCAALLLANLVAWIGALLSFRDYPLLLGTSLLAYTLGLRHAVDIDHIAAIDNVTRKLMQEGQRPIGVGFFFSLGHSTVVVLASAMVALTAMTFKGQIDAAHAFGGIVGTALSAAFLLLIGALNCVILVRVYRTFQDVRAGGQFVDEDLNLLLARSGFLARGLRSLFRAISRSWHMYPLGILFGLGFDTATEISVLGIAAAEGSRGLPLWSILVFPVLFTAGMTLIDTADGILMLRAYGWAFVKPVRKLYYNLTITLTSVIVALVVGAVEILGLVGNEYGLDKGIWRLIGRLNSSFGTLGYLIIGLFVLTWLVSIGVYRVRHFDEIEVQVGVGQSAAASGTALLTPSRLSTRGFETRAS
jgi:high-affinity nickel-transport protein